MRINQIYNMDCLLGIQKMLEHGIQVDLIVADPPYYIKSTKAGGHSELARSIQPMNDQLAQNKLTVGIIGFEINPDYHAASLKRLAAA